MEKPTESAALLLCPIHLQLFDDPVLCPCGHTFCRACIFAEIARSGKCPFDGVELQPNAIFTNQLIAEEVKTFLRNGGSLSGIMKPVRCSFEEYGCTWKVRQLELGFCMLIHRQGPSESLKAHLETCDYDKMKDFILKKERETSALREEMRSKDQKIVELQQLLSASSPLVTELNRLLKLAQSLGLQGKTFVERGVGHVVGSITSGWSTVTDEKTYKELSHSVQLTAQKCATSVQNVISTIQTASKHISDAELLSKLLAQVGIPENVRQSRAHAFFPDCFVEGEAR